VQAAVLVVLCAALYLPGRNALPPIDRDEALYAQATRQMLAAGDLVVPRVGDSPRLLKPIGIYWLQAAAVRLTGGGTVGAIGAHRIPSLLGAVAAVLGTWWIGRRLLAPPAAGLGAALLAAAALLVLEAHMATTDAALLACIVAAQGCLAALFAAVRRGDAGSPRIAAGFWLAQAAGVLLKGPVAPLVATLTVVTLALIGSARERAAGRRLIAALRPWWGVPLALVCVAPWVIAVGRSVGWDALPRAMAGDILPKVAGVQGSHGGPPGFYLLVAPVVLWPGCFVLPFALSHGWRRRRHPAVRFLLAWLVPTWIFFECLPTKLPNYILPTVPALALLAGRAALRPPERLLPPLFHPLARAIVIAWGALTAAGGIVILAAVSWLGGGPRAIAPATLAALAAAIAGWLVVRLCWRAQLARAALTAVAGATVFYALLLQLVLPRLDALWLSRTTVAAIASFGAARPLVTVGYGEPSLAFLSSARVRQLPAEEAAAALAADADSLAAVSREHAAAFVQTAARHGLRLQHRGAVEGLDYTRGRWVELQLFAAEPSQRRSSPSRHPDTTRD
jgi:4-amino-4-deoxy-L-arabinose transferase-like glycosyltransferase